MQTIVVVPPQPVVTWADADAHLKLEGDTGQQAEVEAMIAAATGHIDGPDGWLGRAIGVQTLEAHFDTFCSWAYLPLPYPPVLEIVVVKWLDARRVAVTGDPADYELIGDRVFATGASAPWTGGLARHAGLSVKYRAGYQILPPAIRAAILLMVGDLYRNRGTVTAGQVGAVPMSTTVENLLSPFRKWA